MVSLKRYNTTTLRKNIHSSDDITKYKENFIQIIANDEATEISSCFFNVNFEILFIKKLRPGLLQGKV